MSARLSTRPIFAAALATIAVTAACRSDRANVLDPIGDPALNFPMSAVGAANADLPGGSLRVSRPATGTGTVTVTLRNLEPMSGAVYKVWLAEIDTATKTVTTWTPATGTVLTITPSETGADTVTATATASFNGVANSDAVYELTVDGASLGGDPTSDARNAVVVSIETSASAATPGASSPKPLWARYANPAAGATRTATFSFGNFDADPAKQYVFPVTGRGRGAVRNNLLVLDDSSMGRPPRGYYYAAYAYGVDTSTMEVSDTVSLGELTAPYPRLGVSLRDADMSIVDEVVSDRPYAIYAAALRYQGPASFSFVLKDGARVGYPYAVVALKNKLAAADVAPPNTVLLGNIPSGITIE